MAILGPSNDLSCFLGAMAVEKLCLAPEDNAPLHLGGVVSTGLRCSCPGLVINTLPSLTAFLAAAARKVRR